MKRAVAIVGPVILILAVAGCGASQKQGGAAPSISPRTSSRSILAAGPFGPAARRSARELLGQLVLPPGAQRLPFAPRGDGSLLHQPQATPGVRQLVAVHRIWRVPRTLSSARSFVEVRLHRGAHWAQRGSAGGPGTPPNELDTYSMPTGGRVSVFFLDLAFVSLPHGWTGIRADALIGSGPLLRH